VHAFVTCLCCRQSILDVCGQVPPEAIKQLVAACKSGMYARMQQQVRQEHDGGWHGRLNGAAAFDTQGASSVWMPSTLAFMPECSQLPMLVEHMTGCMLEGLFAYVCSPQ
jgi:hypothetical protein